MFSNNAIIAMSSNKVIKASDKLTQKQPSIVFANNNRPI